MVLQSIPIKLLKLIPTLILVHHSTSINQSFLTGKYPDDKRFQKSFQCIKGGATDDLNNYKPISLSIFYSHRKLIHKRLYEFLQDHNILFHNQFGFRRITEKIKETIDNKEFGCGLYLYRSQIGFWHTSLDKLTVFNADHRIILSCTKSVRALFERRKSKKLKPEDVSYNGQVIPASASVKFLGITFDSSLTLHTLANITRHRLLKMNSIFTSTYGPSTLIRLYKSYIRSLFDYGAPVTCVASPHVQRIWVGGTNTLHNASNFHSMLHPQRQKTAVGGGGGGGGSDL